MEKTDFQLNEGLQLRGCSVEHFAALAVVFGIPKASKAKLYEAFRGGKVLDKETAQRLWELWECIEVLATKVEPFPVPYHDIQSVKLLLDLLKDGHDLAVQILIRPSKQDSNSNTQQ